MSIIVGIVISALLTFKYEVTVISISLVQSRINGFNAEPLVLQLEQMLELV